jgi:hypothetical protein
MMNPLQEYFQNISQQLDTQYRLAASVGTHKGDRGTSREAALLKVLQNHLPERLKAELGGQIIGSSGSISKQVDIIIRNDLAIRFDQLERSFVVAEGVAAVVSVKSHLDKDALLDCLDNFASIPQFDPRVISFPNLGLGSVERFSKHHPNCFIFAFDGLRARTLGEHMDQYVETRPQTFMNRIPRLTFVNRQSTVSFLRESGTTLKGVEAPPDNFYVDDPTPEMYGWPFTFILHELSKYLTWLPHMQLDFSPYFFENLTPELDQNNR